MPGKGRFGGKRGRAMNEKKEYQNISYWTRLMLIKLVFGKGLSCTEACFHFGVKLTTGCLILRTFLHHNRIMKKPEPILLPAELQKRLKEIQQLEPEVQQYRNRQLNSEQLVKREEEVEEPDSGEPPEDTYSLDHHSHSPQVKLEPQEEKKQQPQEEEVKREEEEEGPEIEKREAVRQAFIENYGMEWVFPVSFWVWTPSNE